MEVANRLPTISIKILEFNGARKLFWYTLLTEHKNIFQGKALLYLTALPDLPLSLYSLRKNLVNLYYLITANDEEWKFHMLQLRYIAWKFSTLVIDYVPPFLSKDFFVHWFDALLSQARTTNDMRLTTVVMYSSKQYIDSHMFPPPLYSFARKRLSFDKGILSDQEQPTDLDDILLGLRNNVDISQN